MGEKRRYFVVSVDAEDLEGQGFDPTQSCDFTTLDPLGVEVSADEIGLIRSAYRDDLERDG